MKNSNQSTRRDFIKKNAVMSLGMLALGNTSTLSGGEKTSEDKVITKIGEWTLEQLRDRFHAELFDNFLPNMDRYAVDDEYGGVMCSMDVRTGKLTSTEKTAWFVGRGLWVYSFLYNNLVKDPRYLEIATKSKDLLLKVQPKDKGLWPETFSREGTPLAEAENLYGSLFVAEGLAEYAKASGDAQYRTLAKQIIFSCVDRYDRPDYNYHMTYLDNAPKMDAPRVMGHWMVFLGLSTQMLKHEPDSDLEKLVKRSVDAIMNHHLNPSFGLTNEVLNHDLSLPDNAYNQFSHTGHGLETLAFMMHEADRTRDTALFDRIQEAFKKHGDVAKDAVYGGYFHSIRHVDDYTWNTGKSLWCQQEVLCGSLFMIEHTGDEWAIRTFADTYRYIHERYDHPGNKFWYLSGDRKLQEPDGTLLEHYHHARWLMLGLLSLERMIDRKGAISNRFA